MLKDFKKYFISSFNTIMPIVILVLCLSLFIETDVAMLLTFTFSSILLVIGSALFTFGTDFSLIQIGNKIGKDLVMSKKIWLIIGVCLIIGTVVTIAEPDLIVLTEQVSFLPNMLLILIISLGVGLCVSLAAARSIFGWNLNVLLIIGYLIIFALVLFVPTDYIPFAFDSGGVTTGTISIPFMLTLGMGLTANRIDKKAREDSFGLVSLASTGPIIMVLILGLFTRQSTSLPFDNSIYLNASFSNYGVQLISSFKSVLLAISPILLVFFVYSLITRKISKIELHRIVFGIILTIVGLTIFLVASNIGFLNMGYYIGEFVVQSNFKYILIPIIMLLSFFIAIAEPAVVILIEQIKDYTEGSISEKALKYSLAIGVSIAAGLSILRIFTKTPFFYYAIVGYGIALLLTFIIPKVFTAIAFDAGGATGGSLTTTFLLPICIGACMVLGGNVYTDAFGLASMISLVPIITIEFIGVIYQIKINAAYKLRALDDTVVDYDWEVDYV